MTRILGIIVLATQYCPKCKGWQEVDDGSKLYVKCKACGSILG